MERFLKVGPTVCGSSGCAGEIILLADVKMPPVPKVEMVVTVSFLYHSHLEGAAISLTLDSLSGHVLFKPGHYTFRSDPYPMTGSASWIATNVPGNGTDYPVNMGAGMAKVIPNSTFDAHAMTVVIDIWPAGAH